MQKYIPIKTKVGYLKGRDCIYLDKVSFNDSNSLTLKGEINGNLCSENLTGQEIPYSIKFKGVMALEMIELDSWDYNSTSSFDEIIDSGWIKELGGKINNSHKHIFLQTYDEVFNVICDSYEIKLFNDA